MVSFIKKIVKGYRVRMLIKWYYDTFYGTKAFLVKYNDITGPYKLSMRLSDGRGMRKRLVDGTEMDVRKIFLPLLKKGWVCCDIGAHVGDYMIEMALIVGPTGKVKAYEAIPHYFRLLNNTVDVNNLNNIEVKLSAVGSSSGSISLPDGMLSGSLSKPGLVTNDKLVDIPIVRLDDELKHLNAIKIDVEGYEIEVLNGMQELINKNPDILIFLEVHNRKLKECGGKLSQLANILLNKFNFVIYKISFKHCICTSTNQELDQYKIVNTIDNFVDEFYDT